MLEFVSVQDKDKPEKREVGALWMSGAQDLTVFLRNGLQHLEVTSRDVGVWKKPSLTC